MTSSLSRLVYEPQLLDFESRQLIVFQEVLENFGESCCENHDNIRQQVIRKARWTFTLIKIIWKGKEKAQQRRLAEVYKLEGLDITSGNVRNNNFVYHLLSIILALWCEKLSQLQFGFEASHGYRLLDMKMPPGSHEVSPKQFELMLKAVTPTLATAVAEPMSLLVLLETIRKSRTHSNPAVFHMFSLVYEKFI